MVEVVEGRKGTFTGVGHIELGITINKAEEYALRSNTGCYRHQ